MSESFIELLLWTYVGSTCISTGLYNLLNSDFVFSMTYEPVYPIDFKTFLPSVDNYGKKLHPFATKYLKYATFNDARLNE